MRKAILVVFPGFRQMKSRGQVLLQAPFLTTQLAHSKRLKRGLYLSICTRRVLHQASLGSSFKKMEPKRETTVCLMFNPVIYSTRHKDCTRLCGRRNITHHQQRRKFVYQYSTRHGNATKSGWHVSEAAMVLSLGDTGSFEFYHNSLLPLSPGDACPDRAVGAR